MRKQFLMMVFGAMTMLVCGSNAFAGYGSSSMEHMQGFAINPGISYWTQTNDNGGTNGKTTQSNFYLDAKLDYHFMNGFYVGGNYTTNSYSTQSGGATTNGSLTAIAPLVGYEVKGFFIEAEYFFTSNLQVASNNTYKSGTGFGINIGYLFMFDKFFVGPSFAYKSLTYTQFDNGTTVASLTNNYKYSEIVPILQLGLMF